MILALRILPEYEVQLWRNHSAVAMIRLFYYLCILCAYTLCKWSSKIGFRHLDCIGVYSVVGSVFKKRSCSDSSRSGLFCVCRVTAWFLQCVHIRPLCVCVCVCVWRICVCFCFVYVCVCVWRICVFFLFCFVFYICVCVCVCVILNIPFQFSFLEVGNGGTVLNVQHTKQNKAQELYCE